MYYAGMVNKSLWHIHSQINKTENSPKVDQSKYGNLVYDKSTCFKAEKINSSINNVETTGYLF